MNSFTLQFVLRVDPHFLGSGLVCEDSDFCWIPIGQATSQLDLLINNWRKEDPLASKHFQAGFLIDIDGKRWNGQDIDELWMTTTWFIALEKLLKGENQAVARPWEESELVLERSGEVLKMHEAAYQTIGDDEWGKPVEISFPDFCRAVANEAEKLVIWADNLRDLVKQQKITDKKKFLILEEINEEQIAVVQKFIEEFNAYSVIQLP
jgi:hypothetical protein